MSLKFVSPERLTNRDSFYVKTGRFSTILNLSLQSLKFQKYIFTYHVSKKNYDSTIDASFGDFENWHLLQTVLFLIPKRKIRFFV